MRRPAHALRRVQHPALRPAVPRRSQRPATSSCATRPGWRPTRRPSQPGAARCAFVNDDVGAASLAALHRVGVRTVVLRSAGFNHVHLDTARALGIGVARVPAYSPHAVAEHAVGLILALNRHLHRAYNRVRENNFALSGLLGFDLHGRRVGVVGTGAIGAVFARIMVGFGCEVVAADPYPDPRAPRSGCATSSATSCWRRATSSPALPLTPDTHHLIDAAALASMTPGAMLINTSRGALVDTVAAIEALKAGRLGHLGLDVYEEEGDLFYEDLSNNVLGDDVFARLLTFPNVLITGHQAFFTADALERIAATTVANLTAAEQGRPIADNLVV
ncbi:MAG: 2-hydroxyacid dehydrogenase [Acidimicrobiales bacterium]